MLVDIDKFISCIWIVVKEPQRVLASYHLTCQLVLHSRLKALTVIKHKEQTIHGDAQYLPKISIRYAVHEVCVLVGKRKVHSLEIPESRQTELSRQHVEWAVREFEAIYDRR